MKWRLIQLSSSLKPKLIPSRGGLWDEGRCFDTHTTYLLIPTHSSYQELSKQLHFQRLLAYKIKVSWGRRPTSKLKVFFIAISRNNKGRKLIFGMELVFKLNKRFMEEKNILRLSSGIQIKCLLHNKSKRFMGRRKK